MSIIKTNLIKQVLDHECPWLKFAIPQCADLIPEQVAPLTTNCAGEAQVPA